MVEARHGSGLHDSAVLLWGQQRLGLSPELLNVLLQIISHWWNADEEPFPSKEEIARRMGRSARQVQRYLKELEIGGFIRRIPRMTVRGQTSNKYSLEGTVAKLKAIEPDFRRAAEEHKKLRTEAETPVRRRGKRPGASPVA
jgi:DNA-binding transcriptional MocR family regulator